MDDLVAWLRQQLDEDERVAREAQKTWAWEAGEHMYAELADETVIHVRRHAPVRVLREVEAKRRLLDEVKQLIDTLDTKIESEWGDSFGPTGESDLLVKLLALPYSDRPGYREEWRP